MKRLAWMLLSFGVCSGALAQAPAAGKACSIVRTMVSSRADEALSHGRLDEADKLFTAMLPSSTGVIGLERTKLQQHKFDEALTLAQKESDAKPADALLLQGLGEVRFRRGEMVEATMAFNKSQNLDVCLARTHYDLWRYLELEGRHKTAQAELEKAHSLAPGDTMITQFWEYSHRKRPTSAERITQYEERMARPDATEEQKTRLAAAIKSVQVNQRGDCRMATPAEHAKVSLTTFGNVNHQEHNGKAALEVYFNGKKRLLLVDTGASGLSLTKEAASALGLTAEAPLRIGGIGDDGAKDAFVTHVDSIKIGPMNFQNCQVEVFSASRVLPGLDGLIGTDVFSDFLVTLDFPSMDLKLDPLPKRPGEVAGRQTSLGTNPDDNAGLTYAETKTDPYIAPEMAKWTPVYRAGHFLIMPTNIGNAPKKLFILDTGGSINLISPAAAREVTAVSKDDEVTLRGIGGKVKDTATTGRMTIQFAGVRQKSEGLMAIDMSSDSRYAGVELAGMLGYETLKQLKMEIDYRDNLVRVTYVDQARPDR